MHVFTHVYIRGVPLFTNASSWTLTTISCFWKCICSVNDLALACTYPSLCGVTRPRGTGASRRPPCPGGACLLPGPGWSQGTAGARCVSERPVRMPAVSGKPLHLQGEWGQN